ncbi:MAG: amidohydrolase family protein [Bacteroidetes bacterium]|nr:amidohydrolase family protein [Bacteroidota bacterium]
MLKTKFLQIFSFIFLFLTTSNSNLLLAQENERSIQSAPPRAEGDGPFNRLIIRGATMIDGTGSPPMGPVDIVVEKNKIVNIVNVGYPGLAINDKQRPKANKDDKELDASGMYILPGFVDMHGHIGGKQQGTPAEYVFKLWMGHGITTIRDPGSGNGLDWTKEHKLKSEKNEITAPRIAMYVGFGMGHKGPISTPEQARAWVADVAKKGADGLKLNSHPPEIMAATIDETKKQGIRTAAHHAQMGVARMNVLNSARLGLTTMEHWYGLPEALFTDRTIQDYPLDYNYSNEQHRFANAGNLWKQAAPPFSAHWNKVMNELIDLDFTIVPTMTIYEANRDLMLQYRAEWHEEYTLPSLWEFYKPNRAAHGSYWFNWGTEEEVAWKNNFHLWMQFINEYKNRGGRVAAGSDAGYIYKLYGFGFIRELELLREAGFHPLEVIRAGTLKGAEALGYDDKIGTIEIGKLADFAILEENPLQNLKTLYGTGALKLNDNNEPTRVGGVKYTIKDGIIYDAKKLLSDVREIVKEAKIKSGKQINIPGKAPAAN